MKSNNEIITFNRYMRVECVAYYTLKNCLTDFNENFNLFLDILLGIRIVYKVV